MAGLIALAEATRGRAGMVAARGPLVGYHHPRWEERFLDAWITRALRSRLAPIRKVAQTFRDHEPLIVNWFACKKALSNAAVEGLNNKIRVVTRRSYGFRQFPVLQTAVYHALGHLPEPELTHRFC